MNSIQTGPLCIGTFIGTSGSRWGLDPLHLQTLENAFNLNNVNQLANFSAIYVFGRNPRGRFSDGKLEPDFLASILRIKENVPPFLHPNLSDEEIVTGVSFASAGSGYDELTTSLTGSIPMSKQLELFQSYQERLKKIVGGEGALSIVADALVIISTGTNDFVLNFYDIQIRHFQMSIYSYQDLLIMKLQNFVMELFGLRCRKMAISGVPSIGCLPIQLTAKSPLLRRCIHEENLDAQSFNRKLRKLLQTLQEMLPSCTLLHSDVFTPLMDMIKNPEVYGFVETRRGCCGSGVVEVGPLCSKHTAVCTDPSRHIFFDIIHPCEATYKYITDALVKELLLKF
ncbi:hydrolase [Lithospermum erythrorhizon]|uniref:Hydrolase n=1 Tax=Lithospermum erythrorhizon TaxID=34254 RepID=A0AAV3P4S4_LITER